MSEDVIEQPPVEAPQEPEKVEPVTEDADLDQILEEKTIEIPGDTDKLVPLAAVENARAKLKTVRAELEDAKKGSAKAAELEGQLQALQQQLNAALPLAQAYQAALQAQPREEPKGPTAEELSELEDIARDNDYYKTDGSLDMDRAKRFQARIDKAAERKAAAMVAPLEHQTTQSQSAAMLRAAKMTAAPDGSLPDPGILDGLWSQLDSRLTSTREGALQVWRVAMGDSAALGKLIKKGTTAMKETIPPPLLTEKSGGRDREAPTLSASEKRFAREAGISEADYAKSLAEMPKGWGAR
jgi:hypothetical protein